jgi:hypothetical protein
MDKESIELKESQNNIFTVDVHGSDGNKNDSFSECSPKSIPKKKKKIFTLNHMKEAWATLTKRRPDNFHRTLWFLLSYVVLANMGAQAIFYSLVQRIYDWDYIDYTRVGTIATILQPVTNLAILPIALKYFKVRDLQISMLGAAANIIAANVVASVYNPWAYYFFITFTSLSTCITLGVRSFLSKNLPKDEMSKIFSLFSSIEVIQKFVASFLFSSIFRASITFYPTLAVHVRTLLLIVSLAMICYTDLSCLRIEMQQERKEAEELKNGRAQEQVDDGFQGVSLRVSSRTKTMQRTTSMTSRRSSIHSSIMTPGDYRRMSVVSYAEGHLSML